MNKPRPYIGVTGLKTPEEFDTLSEFVYDGFAYDKANEHDLMLGFTCSNKRLEDPKSEGKTSPSIQTLSDIFDSYHPQYRILPMIHYFTDKPEQLSAEIFQLFDYIGIRNLQLNAHWPHVNEVEAIRNECPDIKITLQIPNSALVTPINVCDKLKVYEGLVDYALVDPSGGAGLATSVDFAVPYLKEIDHIPSITPGFAGGLSAENVKSTVAAIKEGLFCTFCQTNPVRQFCIDAQGRLRDKDGLNLELTKQYINNAVAALK